LLRCVTKCCQEDRVEIRYSAIGYRRKHGAKTDQPDSGVLESLENLIFFQSLVLGTRLVVLDAQKSSDFLGIREPLGLDWAVRQEDTDDSSDHDSHRADCQEEDSPALEL